MSNQHEPSAAEPRVDRPRFPKGYKVPADTAGLLSWAPTRERLEQAPNYWLCTVGPGGRAHVRPLWGVWLDNRLYFEGSPLTRWARNMAANPQVSVHLESAGEAVIVEGTVEDVEDVGEELYTRVTDVYAAKYDGYRPEDHGFYVLRPRIVYAWSAPLQDATRWTFGEP
jgi:nitroimidazol reductase NimA-like FMN-containing flavoprotein (pyridoxamine 5'-phosphate oxidase superfamily)